MPSEVIQAGGITVQFLVEGEESNGTVSAFRATIPVGAGMPMAHSHDAFEETNVGVRGTLTFTVDGRPQELGPGDVLCIPRGVVHGFANRGEQDAEILSMSTPALFSIEYFREIAAVLEAAAGGPPDKAAMADIMRRHGLTPVVAQPA